MLVARHVHEPKVKLHGNGAAAGEFVCFTSKHSHYTVERAASVLGLGSRNCIKIPTDPQGRMLVDDLDQALTAAKQAGNKQPFFVNATCGTTVFGAYDNVEAIAKICRKHGVWLHLDACWGGHCLFSSSHYSLMQGCQLADSIALTGTKCLGLPQQCAGTYVLLLNQTFLPPSFTYMDLSLLLLLLLLLLLGLALIINARHGKKVLEDCSAMKADYLFHDYEEKDYDLGDRTLNCGRRVDALKLWVALRVHGRNGLRDRVDHAFAQAQYCADLCRNSDGEFELAHEPQSLNVCFWYKQPNP
jgi:glutamate/tyrosine decarboxylase-like PLP-dependent enzyme